MPGKNQTWIAAANPVIFSEILALYVIVCYYKKRCKFADVAELVDALDLGSSVFGREGSSPFIRMASAFIWAEIFTLTPEDSDN